MTSQRFSSKEELAAACDAQVTKELRSLFKKLKPRVKKELNAKLTFPSTEVCFFRYRPHFVFFEPPLRDSNGGLRKNSICLACFIKDESELKLFKATRVGFYNHLCHKHAASFKISQKTGEPVLSNDEPKQLTQNGSIRKKAGRKRKKNYSVQIENEEDLIPVSKIRSRRGCNVNVDVVDTFSIGATIILPSEENPDFLGLFKITSNDTKSFDESVRMKQEKSDLMLLKLSLSLDIDFMSSLLPNEVFKAYINSILSPKKKALKYSLPNEAKLKHLQVKMSNFLLKKMLLSLKVNNKKASFISLILCLRYLNNSANLAIFTVTISFLNTHSWTIEYWNILEISHDSSKMLDIVGTLNALLKLLEIKHTSIAHIYCDLELPPEPQLAENVVHSPLLISILASLKSNFPASRLLETSITSMITDIIDLSKYGITPSNIFPQFMSWIKQVQQYLPNEQQTTDVSLTTFNLCLPELLEAILNNKSSIMIKTNNSNEQNWIITEELLCLMKPFTVLLKRTNNTNTFSKGFIIPWLLFTQNYYKRKEYTIVYNIDNIQVQKTLKISNETVQIISTGILQKVNSYIDQVIRSTEGDHLVLFTILDPRTKSFLKSKLMIKARNLISRIIFTQMLESNSRQVAAEIDSYVTKPYGTSSVNLTDFASLCFKMDENCSNPFKWLYENSSDFPHLFKIALQFLPYSFVTLSELESKYTQHTLCKATREESYRQSFLRINWRVLEDSNCYEGFKSLLSAVNYSSAEDDEQRPVKHIEIFKNSEQSILKFLTK